MPLAINDHLIREFIKDDRYIIYPSGIIHSRAQKGNTIGRMEKWINVGIGHANKYCYIGYHQKTLLVHRIIWAGFGNTPLAPHLTVNHLNGIKNDNRIENLELVSQHQNVMHSRTILGNNRVTFGNAKITLEIANDIRADRKAGMLYREILLKYKQLKSLKSISLIINNKTWINPKP